MLPSRAAGGALPTDGSRACCGHGRGPRRRPAARGRARQLPVRARCRRAAAVCSQVGAQDVGRRIHSQPIGPPNATATNRSVRTDPPIRRIRIVKHWPESQLPSVTGRRSLAAPDRRICAGPGMRVMTRRGLPIRAFGAAGRVGEAGPVGEMLRGSAVSGMRLPRGHDLRPWQEMIPRINAAGAVVGAGQVLSGFDQYLGSAVDVAVWSVNLGVDVRERALAWLEGVYLGGWVRAGQGSATGVSW